jgi:hypothetical protein
MMQRRDIETRDAHAIAQQLTAAFDQFCAEGRLQPAPTTNS